MNNDSKAYLTFFGIIALIFLAILCFTERGRQMRSHFRSSMVGITRKVTLYDTSGHEIKSWSGKLNVEAEQGSARFVVDGRTVIISGTYIVEEQGVTAEAR